ncbi:hypothetical protein C2S52_005594 [Perilla frutescens var. hirtella]|nr:hypothetical protein C2S52_005594 [Perilla frutescens var. hirtella]
MSGEAALKFLLEHVTEVLKDYQHLKAAARYEFVKLKNELDVLESYLKDADKKFKKTEVWKTMETQIRDIVYDAEDIIETYLTKKAAAKAKIVSRFKEKLSSGKEQQIKFFRQQRLTPFVSDIHKTFGNKADGDGSSTSLEVEKDQSLIVQQSLTVTHDQSNKQDDVVDFKDEATIKRYLLEPEEKLDVISITGMPGLGKTTLAWKIFHDEEIRRQFRKCIWIDVSQNFKSRDVCHTILQKLISKHMSIAKEEELIKTVHGALEKENEEFLLVMDDVWRTQDWEVIETMLPKNNGKGKVLVTSRHMDVAIRATNVKRDPLKLQTLGPEKKKSDEAVSEEPNVRRLCLHSHPSNFLFGSPTKPGVRSFLCFFKEPFKFDSNHISNIPEAFNLLRVLNCKSITFHQFPKVGKLILLKYITLCIDNLDVLPDLISQLLNLQTLIVDTKSSSIKVEPNIWKMVQLRRLKTKAAIFLDDKNWKGRARGNLQTISRLSPESCRKDLSERAPNLKILGIQGKVANLFNTFSLVKFCHLEKLKIVNEVPEHPLSIMGPQTGGFPGNLKRLTLSKTKLRWNEHMHILSKINNLKVLKLKDNAFEGAYWVARESTVFPTLQFLLIENSGLVIWKTTLTSHFPSLTWLMLKNCKGLEEIPESLAAGNLEKLELEGIKESAVECAMKIESILNKGKRAENTNGEVPFKLTVKSESVLKPIHQSH